MQATIILRLAAGRVACVRAGGDTRLTLVYKEGVPTASSCSHGPCGADLRV